MSSDDEWQYTTVTFPECPKHPGVYHKMTGECEVYAEGERAATERIVKWLRGEYRRQQNPTGQMTAGPRISYETCERMADAIERNDHKEITE